jgi:hypothetical protein
MSYTFYMNAEQFQAYVDSHDIERATLSFNYGGSITVEFDLGDSKEEFDIREGDAFQVQLILDDEPFYTEVFQG